MAGKLDIAKPLAERHGIEIHGPLPEAPAEFGR